MIKSDAQLSRTEAQLDAFRQTVAEIRQTRSDRPKEVKQAVIASHEGMIRKLEAEVKLYQDLKRGVLRMPRLLGLKDYGVQLVRFRVALGITQEELAELVGVTRQTINKHEEQEYQAAPLVLVNRVSEVLGILPEIAVRHKNLTVQQPQVLKTPAADREKTKRLLPMMVSPASRDKVSKSPPPAKDPSGKSRARRGQIT